MDRTSQIPGFYKLKRKEKLSKIKEYAGLTDEDVATIEAGLPVEQAEKMVENVISTFKLPLGVAVNFLINGKDYVIPMATEETSVVAAASHAAKLCRARGGFSAESTDPVMIGQIQLYAKDAKKAGDEILAKKKELLEIANARDSKLVSMGGGAKDVEYRTLREGMGVVHLLVNVKDAMGANAVNTMCEAVASRVEELTGGRTHLKIISNLAVYRKAKASVTVSKDVLGGESVVDAIVEAYDFADADPYRAVTHNKGVMNGITAAVIATGNDSRAVEAGAHAYAAIEGRYAPLSRWAKDENGDLRGEIELPLAVGTFGGATMGPAARANLKILGVKTAKELSEVLASLGLAQNLAALRALATEGIQRGHMSLHSKNFAMMAGAKGDEVERIAAMMVKEKNISFDRAKQLVEEAKK